MFLSIVWLLFLLATLCIASSLTRTTFFCILLVSWAAISGDSPALYASLPSPISDISGIVQFNLSNLDAPPIYLQETAAELPLCKSCDAAEEQASLIPTFFFSSFVYHLFPH